jgi:hypothetical protein
LIRKAAGGVAVAVLFSGCPRSAPRDVVYDLARRAPVAERWSAREVLLFGTPQAESALPEGFYREAGGPAASRSSGRRTRPRSHFGSKRRAARAAILDVAPYSGVKDQAVEARLNGTSVGTFKLADVRGRYRVSLPAGAQRTGENRLRFVFARTASPADRDPAAADKRRLSAAFYSLVTGAADDPGLDDLLRRDAPRPFAVTETDGIPSLVLVGPAVLRFALRLPPDAELRFSPELLRSRAPGAGRAAFRVTVESATSPGAETEVWSRALGPNDKPPGEVAVTIRAEPAIWCASAPRWAPSRRAGWPGARGRRPAS